MAGPPHSIPGPCVHVCNSRTSTHCPASARITTAEAFPRERHLTGAIFMGDNKNYRWQNSLLVPRSFHLLSHLICGTVRSHPDSDRLFFFQMSDQSSESMVSFNQTCIQQEVPGNSCLPGTGYQRRWCCRLFSGRSHSQQTESVIARLVRRSSLGCCGSRGSGCGVRAQEMLSQDLSESAAMHKEAWRRVWLSMVWMGHSRTTSFWAPVIHEGPST